MENLPHYRSKYDAAKKVHVYFIPAIDKRTNKNIYFYAIASELLHNEMMRCLSYGDIPHFAVIVEKGIGLPPPEEIKQKIKEYYGFDHNHHDDNG